MKFEKTFYVILSGILITAFLLITYVFPTGASLGAKTSSVKKIYYVDNISNAHQKVIDAFNKKYEGQIEVEAINLSFDKFSTNERKELLARYLRNKSDRIDVFAVDQIWVPRFAKWAVPLSPYYGLKEREKLLPCVLKTCMCSDSLMAYPLYLDITHLYYRDDILKKFPNYSELRKKLDSSITWEELSALAKKDPSKKNLLYIFQADNYEGLICSFFEMMANSNRSFYKNDTLYLSESAFKKVLEQLKQIIYSDKISPEKVLGLKENESIDFFLQNEGLSVRGWTSSKGRATTSEYEEIMKNLRRAPTPHFAGGKPASAFGGWNLMVSKFSTNVSEAVKFINFFAGEESQKIMYKEGGYLPVLNIFFDEKKEHASENIFANNSELNFYKSLMQQGVHRPFFKQYTVVSDILADAIHAALEQEVSVDAAIKTAFEKIRKAGIIVRKSD
ncbi:MAG: hypothetical protein COT22_13840 [Ignavibacteria bacterium CG08_land_8_20_14_0_20_37_9]|nr:MAG: hypothetical protein COT22_13840 [Ignavibacteria bacterium CG08_land_8_20_14_0_20_37_9]PIX94587.1 MAG: hypothetical protein COZ25_04810 [Ignavibacteria bacterium CG_4_10_14_3_um_filter_37_18]PJC59194.1 MAG: hypothetical protein CO025_06935 [Ignavibacteria bacterium CG_4_9_14_0_2_um_filter_37_13]